jgi:hypothetical protein
MKFSSFSRLLIAGIFVWLFTISTAAQDSGGGFGSYTWIDYDEDTNIVTAYSQTDSDYNLMGDYEARVSLTVTNDYGVIVASGYGYDNGNGYASVKLSFAGEAGRTYTAVGTHRAFAYLWDYDYDYYYRYRPVYYYYDNWYFTGFEGGSIYQPWYYSFYRPSYNYFRRRTQNIYLGRTYDSVSALTSNDVSFETVSSGSTVATFIKSLGQTATLNIGESINGTEKCTVGNGGIPFDVVVDFVLPPDASSIFPEPRSFVSNSEKQEFRVNYYSIKDVNYTTGTGKIEMRLRRIQKTAGTTNKIGMRIEGLLSAGGSYSGTASFRLVCP